MEQSRIVNPQSSQSVHAAARAKGSTKPAASDAAQDTAAQGGFMALMAALGDGLPLDGSAEPSVMDCLTDASSAAPGSLYDPTALSSVQGFFASALSGVNVATATAASLQGSSAQVAADGLAGSSRVSWALDPLGDGLVAQTAALDGLWDVKDGDAAAALLAQMHPTLSRGTTSFIQRSEALGALAGGRGSKSAVSEPGKSATVAADSAAALLGALTSASPMREAGAAPGGHEGLGGRESLGLAGLDSVAVLAASQGGGVAENRMRDSSDAGAAILGGGDTQALEPSFTHLEGGVMAAGAVDGLVLTGAEDALAEQVTYWVNQKTQNAEMTLTQDGQPVEVFVSLSGNEAHVTFRSDQEQTRQMLDGSMAQLSDMLRDQGLILSGASVGVSARDGQSSGGKPPQERDSRTGQAKVVAAEDVTERKPTGLDGRRTLDVFV